MISPPHSPRTLHVCRRRHLLLFVSAASVSLVSLISAPCRQALLDSLDSVVWSLKAATEWRVRAMLDSEPLAGDPRTISLPLDDGCHAPASRPAEVSPPLNLTAAKLLMQLNAVLLCSVGGIQTWSCGRCDAVAPPLLNTTLLASSCNPGMPSCEAYWKAASLVGEVARFATQAPPVEDGPELAALLVLPQERWVVVAFRGTRDLDAGAWMTNFQTWQDDVAGGSCGERVHHGWGESWVQLRGRVRQGVEALLAEHPTYRLVVTGHSCGASLATLMAAEWAADGSLSALSPPPLLYSFAGPRVGNPAFAASADATLARRGLTLWRVTNMHDSIPHMPPGPQSQWQHAGTQVWLTPDSGGTDAEVCAGAGACNDGVPGYKLSVLDHTTYLGVSSAGSNC